MFQEIAEFPWNRLELYQEAINLLLKKWDTKKNVERSQIYKKLSNQQKQDLLSQIASINFEQNKYFFKQQELEQCIADYISNLVIVNNEPEQLRLDSLNVLKAIELQHGLLVERARGIYSFSHLTFQEYFTARQISICSDPQILERSLQKLVSRTTDKRWQEIFLLTVGMLRNANYLLQLMKKKVDWIVGKDRQLQEFIAWANYKSQIVDTPYNKGALRAFYIALGITLYLVKQDNDTALDLAGDTLELAFTLDPAFILNRSVAIDLVIDKALVVVLARAINLKLDFTQAGELVSVLNFSIKLTLEPKLKHNGQSSVLCQKLVDLQQQLPNLEPQAQFDQWWQSNGTDWIKQLRSVMINQRHIGYDWQLGDRQKETLRLYYYANQLLLDCLKEDCYVTRDVRSHIEETLLLPVTQLAQPEF
jgi:predicted NACHT family NTPase